MQIKLIDLNCRDSHYNFNMSIISEQDWSNFAYELVLLKDNQNHFELDGVKVVIRDNKAKIKIFYHDSYYHEVEYSLDEFGVESHRYQDSISLSWQEVMTKYYGSLFKQALEENLNIIKQ